MPWGDAPLHARDRHEDGHRHVRVGHVVAGLAREAERDVRRREETSEVAGDARAHVQLVLLAEIVHLAEGAVERADVVSYEAVGEDELDARLAEDEAVEGEREGERLAVVGEVVQLEDLP